MTEPTTSLRALLAEEPYVRALARVLCTGDADDIAQQAWLRALEHGGRGVGRRRSWLGRIVRNVARNLRREERRRRARERAAARPEAVPSSDQLMERERCRRRLVELVDALPSDQRAVVLLRYFEGLPPRAIAARLGLPVGTVWNLHRRGLERLRHRLDPAERGPGERGALRTRRRAWLAPPLLRALPRALPRAVLASAGTALPGTLAMTIKTNFAAAAALLLAVIAWAAWPGGAPPAHEPGAATRADGPSAAGADLPAAAPAAQSTDTSGARRSVASAAPAPPPTGGLLVRVRFADEPVEPAAGVTVHLRRVRDELRSAARVVTDASGAARFEDLPPGRMAFCADRGDPPQAVDIVGGVTREVELALHGIALRGRVVDEDGLGIAGASVEVGMPQFVGADPEVLATTGPDGRFAIRAAPDPCLLGARAEGHLASAVQFVEPADGRTAEVELRLRRGGGRVAGIVVGPDGAPVAGALVCAGAGELQGLVPGPAPRALPALVRTGADGRFCAVGLEPGEQPVWARAPAGAGALAPWRGTCSVGAHATANLRIALSAGAVLRGVVTADDGAPAPDTSIAVGDWGDAARLAVWSAGDGSFELAGLAAGPLAVAFEHESKGEATLSVSLAAGEQRSCAVRLSRGLELRGAVTDGDGAPMANVWLSAAAPGTRDAESWTGFQTTAADGSFAFANCPPGRLLTVEVQGPRIERQVLRGVDPRAGPLAVTVRRLPEPSVHVTGTVTGPDGRPLSGARVVAWAGEVPVAEQVTADDGVFAFGPLVPGRWRLVVRRPGHPVPQIEPRQLGAGARWDLGQVRLEAGGTVVIRSPHAPGGPLGLMIVDGAGRRWALAGGDGEVESPVLAAGAYRLMVWAPEVAAHVVPFQVRAGGQTVLEIGPRPGVRQRLELVAAEGAAVGAGATLSVYRGGEQLVDWWLPAEPGEPWACELCLQPGRYRVAAVGRLRGEVVLEVGERPGVPVRIEMR